MTGSHQPTTQSTTLVIAININPDIISSCTKLVLKEDKIPTGLKMFRLKYFSRRVLIRRDHAEKIQKRGFVGVAFTKVQDFRGF